MAGDGCGASQHPLRTKGHLYEISEGTHGHACRLPGGRLLPGRRRDLRDHAEDREAFGRSRRSGRGRTRPRRGPPQLRRGGRRRRRDGCPHQGPDHGQATAAGGGGRRLHRVGPQLPPSGGRGEGGLAVEEPPGRRPGIWAPGDTVVFDWGEIGPLFVFCAVVAWSRFRFVCFTDNLGAEATMEALAECFEADRRRAEQGTHRPDGMPEGRHGRRAGDPHAGLRALRHPLRVPARLLRGGRPRVQGPGGEPGRLREVRPDDPRSSCRSPTWQKPTPRGGPGAPR